MLILFGLFLLYRVKRAMDIGRVEDRYLDEAPYVFGMGLGCVVAVLNFVLAIQNILQLVKLHVAPRVMVLEKFADLIK